MYDDNRALKAFADIRFATPNFAVDFKDMVDAAIEREKVRRVIAALEKDLR